MEAGFRTPLLDAFRRGEVARDVRLLAAQGAVAPRSFEQLAILALLVEDADGDVRAAADETIAKLPREQVAGVLSRIDTPAALRAFFASRGFTLEAAATDTDGPLVDTDETDFGPEEETAEQKAETVKKLSDMTVPEKVKAAIKGTREMRAILIRDPNKMVAAAVLSCPKLNEQEVESFARMANVSDETLRTIGSTRGWTKNYAILLALTRNPKMPLALSLTFLHRLNDRDVRALSLDRNVPEPLRIAARKKVVLTER